MGVKLTDDFISQLREKIRRATGSEEAIAQFDKILKESKEPPIMIALDIIEQYKGNSWELFGASPVSSVTSDFLGTLLVQVFNVNTKIQEIDGKKHKILTCMVKDNSSSLPLTVFDGPTFGNGDLVLMRNVKGDEYKGRLRVKNTRTSEFEILRKGNIEKEKLTVSQINPESKFFDIEGEIRIIEKDRPVRGEESRMTYGILKDSTGTIPFRAWDINIEEGFVKISGASARVYNGKLYLSINRNSKIELIKKSSKPKNLQDLYQLGSGELEGIGMIMSFITKNPFIDVCSECGRVLRNGKCQLHPNSKPEKIIRITAVLDDGSSSQYVYLYQRNLIELLGEDVVKSSLQSFDISDLKVSINDLVLSEFRFKVMAYRIDLSKDQKEAKIILEFEDLKKLRDDELKEISEKIKGEVQ